MTHDTLTLEQAIEDGIAPWTEIELKTKYYWIFTDKYPVSKGHLLFVPTKQDWENLKQCFEAAYKWGYNGILDEKWEGFNIGQNIGESAGQTVMYPHVHMIPRNLGDCEDPTGGIRNCIPNKGNYKKI